MLQMYAQLQASMHNLHAPRKGNPWIADDFLGGRKPQSIDEKKRNLAAIFGAVKVQKPGEVFIDKDDPITRAGNG